MKLAVNYMFLYRNIFSYACLNIAGLNIYYKSIEIQDNLMQQPIITTSRQGQIARQTNQVNKCQFNLKAEYNKPSVGLFAL